MKRASMYSTILVAALAIGTAGPASAQSGSSAGSGGQSGSTAGPAGQSGTTGTGSGQSGAAGGQAGTSGAGDTTSVASGAQSSGATSPRRDDREDFIEKAAIANMAEIQLGQLASTNAQDPQVKQFAQMMVTEHTQALDQLRSAAGSATLPSSLDKKHQKLQDKLSKLHGAEFDRAYMDAMVDAHKDAEKLLSKRAGKNHDAHNASSASGQSAMAGSAGSTSGSASGTAGASGSGDTSGATGTSGAGTPSQSGDASGTVSGSTSGASASGAVGTSGSTSTYASGASSTPASVDEWASMTLPKVKSHLEQARSIENQVKQQGGGNSHGNTTQGEPKQQQ